MDLYVNLLMCGARAQGVLGLVLTQEWVEPCPGISGYRTLGAPELVSVPWCTGLVPAMAGCRAQGVLKLVLACWWVGSDPGVAV